MSAASRPSLLGATLTLLAGGALAQALPLLAGPVLSRLFAPQAFGVWTQFATVASALAVAVCLRYEQALPLARAARSAQALLALCWRLLLTASVLAAVAGAVLGALGWLPLAGWLAPTVCALALLQALTMWAARAERFHALAASRVLQWGGAAALQVLLGWWLWRRAGAPDGALGEGAAWALAVATPLAALAAAVPLLAPAPLGGWRSVCLPLPRARARRLRRRMAAAAHRWRDFALLNTPHAFLGMTQDALAVALLAGFEGAAAAGFWGLALRYLKAPATLAGGALAQALYPRLAAAQPAEAQRLVRQVLALLGALACVLALVLLAAGPALFAWAFGEPWRAAGRLAQALSPYIGAHFVASPLAPVTMAWGAQAWALRLALIGQAVFLLALAAGLHWGGLQGGAWAVSAAMLPYFGYYFWRLAHWHKEA